MARELATFWIHCIRYARRFLCNLVGEASHDQSADGRAQKLSLPLGNWSQIVKADLMPILMIIICEGLDLWENEIISNDTSAVADALSMNDALND
jgi:hypothetical protein